MKPYFETDLGKLYHGDALKVLSGIESESIQCCITSPPYWGLRDYGVSGQLGLEKTPEEYVSKVVEIFREVRRVLRKDGALWLNLGSSYARQGSNSYQTGENALCQNTLNGVTKRMAKPPKGFKHKDLVPIPWMVAMALQQDGWYLRQDIIWHKPNPMPESVTDRCTKSHEYIFLMSKSAKYYYNQYAIATPYAEKTLTTFGTKPIGYGDGSGLIKSENWHNTVKIHKPKEWKTPDGWDTGKGSHGSYHRNGREKGFKGYEHRGKGDKKLTGHSNRDKDGNLIGNGRANKRSVWTIPTKPYKEAHFATFPPALILPCILAGTAEGGAILEPFAGSGTVWEMCEKYNRKSVNIELNKEYCELIKKRIINETRQLKFKGF